jgi:zinc transport system substrate-binding protein
VPLRAVVALLVTAVVLAAGAPLATAELAAAVDTTRLDGHLTAFCSIPPEQYLIDRIGGNHVTVHVMVGPGQSPHTFEPTPRQMASLADTDVYFAIGLPFEREILDGAQELNPGLLVVDASEGIPRRQIDGERDDQRGDEHGHQGDATHLESEGLTDPHIWLSPRNAVHMARSICHALAGLSPELKDYFDANLEVLVSDLNKLDEELTKTLKPLAGESIYVFHPAFGYFTDAYGLKQIPVEMGGTEPSARELVSLTDKAKEDGVHVIFVQPQFSRKSAEAIAREIGGAVVPIDPLSSSYLENLRSIAAEIRKALAG